MMIRCFLKKRSKDRNYKEILQNDEQSFYVNESQFMILPNKTQKLFFSFNPKREGIYFTEVEVYIFEQYVQTIQLKGFCYAQNDDEKEK